MFRDRLTVPVRTHVWGHGYCECQGLGSGRWTQSLTGTIFRDKATANIRNYMFINKVTATATDNGQRHDFSYTLRDHVSRNEVSGTIFRHKATAPVRNHA